MLEFLVPLPRKVEVNAVDLAAPPAAVWDHVRHGDLGDSPFARALFALRTLPSRIGGASVEPVRLRIDDLRSTPANPGVYRQFRRVSGMLVPFEAEVAWQLDSGPFTYAHWLVDSLEYLETGPTRDPNRVACRSHSPTSVKVPHQEASHL